MMFRRIAASTLIAFIGLSQSASAQEWARKLFTTTTHDFGMVARGAKTEYHFTMKNIFKEDIHIESVRASCGCTTPSIAKDTLKTYEEGAIVAKFNTDSFQGKRSATITVIIDKPYRAEVQLNVAGHIRADVVFDPGIVNLGEVDMGQTAVSKTTVTYFGRPTWKIVDVRSENENFEVELDELERAADRVRYQMTVRLKDSAPAGYVNDQLTLITDEQDGKPIPLAVEGHIVPPLTINPSSLFLGVMKPGEAVTKKLIVRAKSPFSVRLVECGDDCFRFDVPEGQKAIHFVPVTFTAGDKPGKVSATIRVVTDDGHEATCVATASVDGPPASVAARKP